MPVAYPHDGPTHDKGTRRRAVAQYKNFGPNMMAGHAVNHGKGTKTVEPGLAEMRELIFPGKLHMSRAIGNF